jgi:hypothetical protein
MVIFISYLIDNKQDIIKHENIYYTFNVYYFFLSYIAKKDN